MFTLFVFYLKVASKPFFKELPTTKYWFRKFLTFCLAFPKNGFNFITQKFAKKLKSLFPNAQNIRFRPQGSFKALFENASYEQPLI